MNSNFNKNKRNRKILEDWNEKNYTLNDLGQIHSITRERVRQILLKAKRLGLHVASTDEKSKMRKTSKLNSVLDKYKEDFIKLYSSKSPFEISKLLDLTQKQASLMEKFLIKSGEIKRPLRRKFKEIDPEIIKRRKMILQYKTENRTIKEIAILTGFSVPTVMNDIFFMKKQGIFIPNARESGGSLPEEELEFRKGFIEEKIQEGWTKEQIAKGLGLSDGAAVSHFIRKFM